ncbi:MAG TPA: hypothetical protein VKA84_27360 [Gemmatimonadaceae bacterium]|nr:hypothetical protein [Gemmatimonadaceae bacterium]
MVLLAFVGGLMVGGTIGVLVAALCFAAWRSDSAAAATGERMGAARAAGRVDAPGPSTSGLSPAVAARAAAISSATAPAPLADLPVAEGPMAEMPMAAGYAGRRSGGSSSSGA